MKPGVEMQDVTIKIVKMIANKQTIDHPKIGIQAEPKLPPVNKVPKKNTKNATTKPTANCNPIPDQNHFLLLISEFIAPIAAKHGGVNKLNIKYASAATKATTNTTGQLIYIQDFATSTSTIDENAKTSCSSENEDGTKTLRKIN